MTERQIQVTLRSAQALGGLVLLLMGWFGAQIVGPGARMSRLEAQQQAADSLFKTHIVWSTVERNWLREMIEALVRLRCLDNDTVDERRILAAAKLPCNELLGNKSQGGY